MNASTLTRKFGMAAVFATASASVAAGGFDGAFVQAGVGFASAQTAATTSWQLPPNFDAKLDDTRFIGQIAAGYSRSFGRYNLAASVFHVVGDQKAGSVTLDGGAAGLETYTFRNTATWGLSVEPGYKLSESMLVYAKLGYVQTRGKASNVFQGTTYAFDATYGGVLYGAGVRFLFDRNLYAVAELQQVDYQRKTFSYVDGSISIKPSALIGSVGIGYRF